MIVVRCTAKLLERLPGQSDSGGMRSTSALGDWYATLVRTRRGHFVLAMARGTLLPVVVTGRDVRTFPDRLADQVSAMLESYGVPAEAVAREREREAMCDVIYARTDDRTCKLFGVEPPRRDWWRQRAEIVN